MKTVTFDFLGAGRLLEMGLEVYLRFLHVLRLSTLLALTSIGNRNKEYHMSKLLLDVLTLPMKYSGV